MSSAHYLKANTNSDGALGLMDDTATDYPNYATALAVSAMVKARNPGYEKTIEPMVAQLRAQQFDEVSGWTPQHAPYAISRVLPSLPVELPPQSEDGSFQNAVNLVKEDDPLIATTFALYVMARES